MAVLRCPLFPAIVVVSAALLCSTSVGASPVGNQAHPPRIVSPVNNADMVRLHGQVHQLARPQFDRGAVSQSLPMNRMVLLLRSDAEQDAVLRQLLVDLQDQSSPCYHRWLTPDEFGKEFGAAEQDIGVVTGWLKSQGFQINSIAHNRRMIEFSGTAGQVAAAFHTEIHLFDVNGETHYANIAEPSIPAALAPVVSGFVSLHNFPRRSLHHIARLAGAQRGGLSSADMTLANGGHAITPYDFATIYNLLPLWSSGIDGTSQTIAVVGRTNIAEGDVQQFRNYFGLPFQVANYIFNGNDPGLVSTSEVIEAELDIEWSGAVAKNATVDFIISASTNTADGVDLSSLYAVDNNVAPVLSSSFGSCETQSPGDTFYGQLWQQAAAQGISVVVAAGDSGSAGCDNPTTTAPATGGFAVSGLASTPDNVAVGGTVFNEGGQDSTYWSSTNDSHHASALSYIPEAGWNDSGTTGATTSILAGGGGVSSVFATPVWQTGLGVPAADPGNPGGHHRYLPDISLSAAKHDPYFLCAWSSCAYVDANGQPGYYLVYGTSVSAPAFAGIMALVNQSTGSIQGNPNFHLYPLATVPGVFHDITSGNNAVPCSAGVGCSGGMMTGYSAGPGFDLATGWGSIDANALVTNWPNVSFRPTTITGTVSPTSFQHGAAVNISATVSAGSGTPSGAVAAYVVSGGKTTQLGGGPVTNGTMTSSTNLVPGGSGTVYFRYGGDGIYGASTSAGTPVTVSPEPTTLSVTPPTSPLYPNGMVSWNAKVVGQSGVGVPTGSINVFQGASQVGTGTVGPTGTASFVLFYIPSAPGTVTFTTQYPGDASFGPSTASNDVTFGKFDTVVLMSCNNAGQDVLLGFPIQCNTTVSPLLSGMPVPTGSVQYYDGGTPIGSPVPLVNGAAGFTYTNLALGRHDPVANYLGDSNFLSRLAGTFTFSVVASGSVAASVSAPVSSALPGSQVPISASARANQFGAPLTGAITIYDGSTALGTYTAPGNTSSISMSIVVNGSSNPMSLGIHPLTAKYTGDTVWPTTTSATQNLLISNPDFDITGLNPVTIRRGSTAYFYVTIRSISGLSGNVTLTCTGAPAESTCTIGSPAAINSTPSVTITTTAPRYAALHNVAPFFGILPFGFLLVCIPASCRRGRALLLSLVLLLLFLASLSCGGGGGGNAGTTTPAITDPGTPIGTYTLTITGTYGTGATAITHSYPLQVTVQ